MKIYEVIAEPQPVDPVFNNEVLNKALMHYMGPQVYWWVKEITPYNPSSPYKAYKALYTKIANSIIPLLSKPDPDMDLVIKTIDKQIPIVNMPSWIKKEIAKTVAYDKANPPQQPPPGEEWEFVGHDAADNTPIPKLN